MINEKIYKIEYDILSWFENNFIELKGQLSPYFDKIEEVEREFTWVGAFISFKFKNSFKKLSKKELKNKRFNSLFLISSEFEHDVPVSIVFDDNGMLDYIELEMGMRKKEYPKKYKLVYKNVNIIYDYKE